jgi:hypothetical protein
MEENQNNKVNELNKLDINRTEKIIAPSQDLVDYVAQHKNSQDRSTQQPTETPVYKDVSPVDEGDQRAALNRAYQAMGSSMAAEVRQDQQDKEDLQKFAKNAAQIESMAEISGFVEGSDMAVGEVSGFFLASFFRRLFRPRYGDSQSKSKKVLFILSSVVLFVVIAVITVRSVIDFQSTHLYSYTANGQSEYTDSTVGFRVTPPKGWKKIKTPPQGSLAGFMAPAPDTASNGDFTDIINVAGTQLKSQSANAPTLYDYVSSSLTSLSDAATNYQELSSSQETVNGIPATLVTVSFKSGQDSITADTLFVIGNGMAYSVNGQTLTASWSQNEAAIKASLLSFQP